MDSNKLVIDPKSQTLVYNVILFLQNELSKEYLDDERKESVEVAIQCLETAYEVDNETKERLAPQEVDLTTALKLKVEVTPEARNAAEEYKNKGNSNMTSGNYSEAISDYSEAIKLNPYNAIYYCNRAAAHSRLDRHDDALSDCQEALKLDPTYGKAYGRLGIAYSNLNRFKEAKDAYKTALKYDSTNTTYQTNLKLAEEKLLQNTDNAAPPEHTPIDISQFMNNPSLLQMATQMLCDDNLRGVIRNIMSSTQNGEGGSGMDALIQASQSLAARIEEQDPNFVANYQGLRNAMGGWDLLNNMGEPDNQQESPNTNQNSSNSNPTENSSTSNQNNGSTKPE